ncbi:uncharacterized protein LOC107042588 [Diachasma alloeum]|uniref:uncharacterized protein LOC107042588 n=1 Tax=Diachasma alloeum TaxID=454923 RepID=UPI00073834BC|nr:uncharacterized protein LOC107042588 [Diachasma alloeum]
MNRDSEEQRPISQTFCGALQKEANCKCLVLSVLIYGCLAAVTWCRCANVTKIVINFSKIPLKSTRHVSPCDDGYIYIPMAFMGMLYLVYLVECYHSPIRLDLKHGESQDNILSKLAGLRLVQPTIWWKAVSYHYVRRKRQITRYRNGDNYTTTQVYYERVNTNAATSFYFYDYCGVKDISKELTMDAKIPITKITLSKGFAFSNMRSATEFEEARSRFFAEQELRDDYMEMREGLDLGYNFNASTTLVAVLGRPWFTNSYVYWCLSALLLSWPLRIIIECNTQYADYQITKLFGVNYDTPTSGEPIHASSSQLSAPGSYMLAPSYSEALLMEPAGPTSSSSEQANPDSGVLVPSYSEALLYERPRNPEGVHEIACSVGRSITNESLFAVLEPPPSTCNCSCHQARLPDEQTECTTLRGQSTTELRSCGVCSASNNRIDSLDSSLITRDISEPNLRTNSCDLLRGNSLQFLRVNGRSLENILESEEGSVGVPAAGGRGAIPKRRGVTDGGRAGGSGVTIARTEGGVGGKVMPESKTYFCLKSILKQNRRRYTLVTTEEFRNLVAGGEKGEEGRLVFMRENCLRGGGGSAEGRRENPNRTLIFASPIHEVCRPNDPFAGTHRHRDREAMNSPPAAIKKLGRSLTVLAECEPASQIPCHRRRSKRFVHQRTMSIEPEYLQFFTASGDNNKTQQTGSTTRCFVAAAPPPGLTRSLTERRSKPSRHDRTLRRSFTDERTEFGPPRRMNLNMETSL